MNENGNGLATRTRKLQRPYCDKSRQVGRDCMQRIWGRERLKVKSRITVTSKVSICVTAYGYVRRHWLDNRQAWCSQRRDYYDCD